MINPPEPICCTFLNLVFSRVLSQVTKLRRLILELEESGITTALPDILHPFKNKPTIKLL